MTPILVPVLPSVPSIIIPVIATRLFRPEVYTETITISL